MSAKLQFNYDPAVLNIHTLKPIYFLYHSENDNNYQSAHLKFSTTLHRKFTAFIDLLQRMTYSTPGFWRRIVCLIYEFLLLLAVLFIASFIFHLIFKDTNSAYFRPLFRFYLLVIMGCYFIWFWTHGGQTLAMQTWKMRLIAADGSGLTKKQAVTRYFFTLTGILFFVIIDQLLPIKFLTYWQLVFTSVLIFGSGFIWAVFDRDHQFLHDRLAGTRIIKIDN